MPTLHITNGDSAAQTLREFLTDPVLVTCDVLHDGPAPAVDGDEWHAVRARFLTSAFEAESAATRAALAAFDRRVGEALDQGEVVLWFEHDLFDQLLLIRTLDLIANAQDVASGSSRATVSLICIGAFRGVERFIGLGQLNAQQLASLHPTRTRVTREAFALASEAWRAFRSRDPRELYDLWVRLKADTASLPFLPDALHRLFEEYPSTANGLSRSAAAALRALDAGPLDAGALFHETQQQEARPFLGDLGFFGIIRSLAAARVPLVAVEPDVAAPDLRGYAVSLTDRGRDVLTGRADAVALNGIDEWRGGVHLEGRDRSPWRWDGSRETLVS
jgi:hypothetical protein